MKERRKQKLYSSCTVLLCLLIVLFVLFMHQCSKVEPFARQENLPKYSAKKKEHFVCTKNEVHSKNTEEKQHLNFQEENNVVQEKEDHQTEQKAEDSSSRDQADGAHDEEKRAAKKKTHPKPQEELISEANRYQPYFAMGGIKFFNHPQQAGTTYDLFIPLLQDTNWLFFTDLQIFNRTEKPFEGNVHLGYRYLFSETKQIVGMYSSFDRKRTMYGNYFNQITLGGEYWRHGWFFGCNLYMPVGVKKRVLGENVELHGEKRHIFRVSNQSYEETTRGADIKIGYTFTENLIGYLGGFYFNGEETKVIYGPRIEIDYFIRPKLGKKLLGIFDCVELRAGAKEDSSHGVAGFVELKIKVGLSSHSNQDLSSFVYHMVDLLRRDSDIITYKYNVIKRQRYQLASTTPQPAASSAPPSSSPPSPASAKVLVTQPIVPKISVSQITVPEVLATPKTLPAKLVTQHIVPKISVSPITALEVLAIPKTLPSSSPIPSTPQPPLAAVPPPPLPAKVLVTQPLVPKISVSQITVPEVLATPKTLPAKLVTQHIVPKILVSLVTIPDVNMILIKSEDDGWKWPVWLNTRNILIAGTVAMTIIGGFVYRYWGWVHPSLPKELPPLLKTSSQPPNQPHPPLKELFKSTKVLSSSLTSVIPPTRQEDDLIHPAVVPPVTTPVIAITPPPVDIVEPIRTVPPQTDDDDHSPVDETPEATRAPLGPDRTFGHTRGSSLLPTAQAIDDVVAPEGTVEQRRDDLLRDVAQTRGVAEAGAATREEVDRSIVVGLVAKRRREHERKMREDG